MQKRFFTWMPLFFFFFFTIVDCGQSQVATNSGRGLPPGAVEPAATGGAGPAGGAQASGAATYYVAKNGSDQNSGSMAQPWASLAKAASEAAPGDLVYVRGGTYTVQYMMPAQSGTVDRPISFAAFPGEEVVLTREETLGSIWSHTSAREYIHIEGFVFRWTRKGADRPVFSTFKKYHD